ncbi:hypothetical protein ACH5RR_012985, partial [Cinchona calisaya]
HYANDFPNKCALFVQRNEVVSERSEHEGDSMPELEGPSDNKHEDLFKIPALVILMLNPRTAKM